MPSSKVAIFTDVHLTCVKGLMLFAQTSLRCIESICRYCKKNGITKIWFLGDFFFFYKDYVEAFLLPMAQPVIRQLRDFETMFIAGNHDITVDLNGTAHNLLNIFADYVHIVQDPFEQISLDGTDFFFVNHHKNHLIKELVPGKRSVLLCHIDCNGFFTNSLHRMDTADLSVADLKPWKMVLSGHYHRRSRIHNVQYIGSTHHMRRSDAGNPYGFCILDTKTLKLEFKTYEDYAPPTYRECDLTSDLSKITNSFVRVTVPAETGTLALRDIEKRLLEQGNYSVAFEERHEAPGEIVIDNNVRAEIPDDPMEVFKLYIEQFNDLPLGKEEMLSLVRE